MGVSTHNELCRLRHDFGNLFSGAAVQGKRDGDVARRVEWRPDPDVAVDAEWG
jgi:hypothetical protein